MDWISSADAWTTLLTLTLLEIMLGVDNIVIISVLSAKLPEEMQVRARNIGLSVALLLRILLLLSLSWVIGLSDPLISIRDRDFSGQELLLLFGGMFLIGNSVREIQDKLKGRPETGFTLTQSSFKRVLVEITLLNLVFSLDSVIMAVGLADDIGVMVVAVIISVGVMILCASTVADFVERHPSVKLLALGILMLIGISLVAEGLNHGIPKAYLFGAIGFSIFIEALNLRYRSVNATKAAS